jgi:hypothetical protein
LAGEAAPNGQAQNQMQSYGHPASPQGVFEKPSVQCQDDDLPFSYFTAPCGSVTVTDTLAPYKFDPGLVKSSSLLSQYWHVLDGVDQDEEVSIEVGSSVVQTVIHDPIILRQLTSVLKGVNGKFQWRHPDHILVKCTAKPVPPSWIEEVQLKVQRFILQLKRKHANEERMSDRSWRQPARENFSEDSSY